MNNRLHLPAWCAVLLCVTVAKAQTRIEQVFGPSAATPDERLHVLHDVDHPILFEPHYADAKQWAVRAQALREQALVAEGLWPAPSRTPLNAVIHGKIQRDGYTIEKVFFASMPGHYVSGNLYRPTRATGKLPVILCPHGHWGSSRTGGRLYQASEQEAKAQMEMGAEKTIEGARFPLQARCAMLARIGCIVFFYDMVGYADDQGIDHRTGFTDAEAILRLQSFMGLQTWNSIRAVDFVCSLPDVDVTRIGCTGASGGGTQTILLSLVEPRLSVAFPAVMVSEDMQGGCICENSPLLRVGTNNAEMISCFAPRPLGMTAANDWTREIASRGFPQIYTIYKLYGAQGDVMAWHRSFPHNYNQVSRELMYNWFNRYFKLGQAEPVVEQPFVPVPPEELRVYDAEHPRPADALDATALRKKMTAASDEQIAEMAKDPAVFEPMMKTALGVMIHDRLADPGDVFVGDNRGPQALDQQITLEKGTIRRRDSGQATPFVALFPPGWNGTVVVWVHPDGKRSLFDDVDRLQPPVHELLLNSKVAILAPDLLMTGEATSSQGLPRVPAKYEGQNYGGFQYAYNPSLFGARASDILSAVALARGWQGTQSIRLVAFGKAGPPALAAAALAGRTVDRSAIDLNHFKFDKVNDAADEMMLPGALKYGGVQAIARLIPSPQLKTFDAAEESNDQPPAIIDFAVPHHR